MTEERCPSDFALERALASEPDSDEPLALHLASCKRCRARLEQMRRAGAAYLASPDAQRVRELIWEREPPSGRQRPAARGGAEVVRRLWGPLLLAAISLGAVLLLLSSPSPRDGSNTGADLTPKGGPELVLWLDGTDGPVPVQTDTVPVDTRIQSGLSSPSSGFVSGFVRDGDGLVKLFPEGKQALPYTAGLAKALGPSFRVDSGTHEVTVTLYFSEEPFDVARLERTLRAGGEAAFPGRVLERRLRVQQR